MADSKKLTPDQKYAKFRGLWIEKALADPSLSTGAAFVLVYLAHHYLCRKTLTCFPSQETLAKAVRMETGTVQKHIAKLASRGHLRTVRGGRYGSNTYHPIVDVTYKYATNDPHKSTDRTASTTGIKRQADAHISPTTTRKNMRPTTLNDHFDKHVEGGGAYAPTAKSTQSNIVYSDNVSVNDAENTAPDRGLDGRSGASSSVDHGEYFADHLLEEHDFGERPIEHDVPSITYYEGPADPDDLMIVPEDQEASLRPTTGQRDSRCHIYEKSCEETMVNSADANAIIVTHDFAESYFEEYLSCYLPAVAVDRMMDFLRAGKLTAGMTRDAIASQRESKNGNQKTA